MSSQYEPSVWTLEAWEAHQARMRRARSNALRVTYETGFLHGGLLGLAVCFAVVCVWLVTG